MTDTSFQRANRIAAEQKASHHERMAALVADHAERHPNRFRRVHAEDRMRADWWTDAEMWANPGYSPSAVEHDAYWRLFQIAFSITMTRLAASKPRPVKVVKPWKPLFDLHVEQLLALVVMTCAGQSVALFAPNDLTESEVAVGWR